MADNARLQACRALLTPLKPQFPRKAFQNIYLEYSDRLHTAFNPSPHYLERPSGSINGGTCYLLTRTHLNEVPETWPPRPSKELGSPEVPLFPLPGAFLYPHQLMPLHVFEPRYLALLRDILDSHGQLVIGTVLDPKGDLLDDGSVPVLSVAGLGEVARYDKTEDGRYLIWVLGKHRVTLEEVESEEPYRKVRFQPLPESSPKASEEVLLAKKLRKAILSRHKSMANLPDELPLGVQVDLLTQQLIIPQTVLERIFIEPDIGERAQLALAAHDGYPAEKKAQVEDGDEDDEDLDDDDFEGLDLEDFNPDFGPNF
ncbi:MAG: Lon protease-like protein [Glaciecola sp.]